MAYKIQVGDAIMGGTLTQGGNLTAIDFELSASTVSASGDVIIHGDASGPSLFLRNAGTVRADEKITLNGDADWFVMSSSGENGNGTITFGKDAVSSHAMATFGCDGSNNGSLQLANFLDNVVKVSLINGTLSGSSDLNLGGNLLIAGNLTLGGLTIQGGTSSLNVTNFTVADKIVQLAGGTNINGNGGGLAFGLTGSADTGAQFLVDTAGSAVAWQAIDGDGSGLINISASAFIGSGEQLNNVSTSGIKLSPTTTTSGELASGLNIMTLASSRTVSLPTGSNLLSGQEFIVKITSVGGGNTCTINRSGTDTIDGSNSITLEGDHAAVSLVYNDSGSFSIF